MAESRYEQIVDTIKGEIEAIVGDGGATYWRTYGAGGNARTLRHAGLEQRLFDASLDTLCVVIPDDSTKRRETNRTHMAEARVDVAVAARFEDAEDPFNPASPSRQTLQSRLAQDVERKLMADPALNAYAGLEVVDLKVASEDRSPEATWDPVWAMVILRLAVTYRYRQDAP